MSIAHMRTLFNHFLILLGCVNKELIKKHSRKGCRIHAEFMQIICKFKQITSKS